MARLCLPAQHKTNKNIKEITSGNNKCSTSYAIGTKTNKNIKEIKSGDNKCSTSYAIGTLYSFIRLSYTVKYIGSSVNIPLEKCFIKIE